MNLRHTLSKRMRIIDIRGHPGTGVPTNKNTLYVIKKVTKTPNLHRRGGYHPPATLRIAGHSVEIQPRLPIISSEVEKSPRDLSAPVEMTKISCRSEAERHTGRSLQREFTSYHFPIHRRDTRPRVSVQRKFPQKPRRGGYHVKSNIVYIL